MRPDRQCEQARRSQSQPEFEQIPPQLLLGRKIEQEFEQEFEREIEQEFGQEFGHAAPLLLPDVPLADALASTIRVSPVPASYVLTPTLLEYWAARRIRTLRPTWAGIGLTRWRGAAEGSVVVVCGLAGALVSGIRPGTVLLSDEVGLADGSSLACDPELMAAFRDAARDLDFHIETRPMLTAETLVVGPARERWARHGFVAADMETGLLAGLGLRIAVVRVVLDTPTRPLSPAWVRPHRAVLQPSAWGELSWLCRVALPYSQRAAGIARAGLARLQLHDER